MFPSTFQRTMFPSFLGLHVTSSCSQPLEMRKRGRGEYTTARHTYNPFQSPTPGDKGRKGEEERKVGREKRTSTQSLHKIPTHTFTTPPHHSSLPHTFPHSTLTLTTLTLHPHHSPSPYPLTTHLPTLSPPTFTTHPHHIPSPFIPTTHHSPSPLTLTLTTSPHHSPPPHTLPHYHSPSPLTLTTHPHHTPSPLILTIRTHHFGSCVLCECR